MRHCQRNTTGVSGWYWSIQIWQASTDTHDVHAAPVNTRSTLCIGKTATTLSCRPWQPPAVWSSPLTSSMSKLTHEMQRRSSTLIFPRTPLVPLLVLQESFWKQDTSSSWLPLTSVYSTEVLIIEIVCAWHGEDQSARWKINGIMRSLWHNCKQLHLGSLYLTCRWWNFMISYILLKNLWLWLG